MHKSELKNEMSFTGHDRKVVTSIVDEGIDAWLEGFTRSHFMDDGHRLTCEVHPNEMQILLRRLTYYKRGRDENAERLLDDIVMVFYGYGEG